MKEIIAAVFRSKGKRRMKRSELIYTMSLDLNWFSHEQSKKVVEEAEKRGLIAGDEEVEPTFDIDSVEIPADFKPRLSRDLAEAIVERIAEKTGKSFQEVISEINRKQERMGNLLSFEVVALIVAKEHDVEVADLLEEVERKLFS